MPTETTPEQLIALSERARKIEPNNPDHMPNLAVMLVPNLAVMLLMLEREVHEAVGSPVGTGKQRPRYARSFDAALTLLPPGHDYQVQFGDVNGGMGGTPFAQVGDAMMFGSTPQLALLAAVLMARARWMRDGCPPGETTEWCPIMGKQPCLRTPVCRVWTECHRVDAY